MKQRCPVCKSVWYLTELPMAEEKKQVTHILPDPGSEVSPAGHRVQHDGSGASGLAGDGHPSPIPAKLSNVLLHPLEGEGLVKQTGIDDALAPDLCRREEPKSAQL